MKRPVLSLLESSSDPVERALYKTLRAWQERKAAQGRKRSLGREPGQIAKYGAIAVIESRVRRRSNGFEEVGPEISYESIVDEHSNRFSDEVVRLARQRLIAKQKNE